MQERNKPVRELCFSWPCPACTQTMNTPVSSINFDEPRAVLECDACRNCEYIDTAILKRKQEAFNAKQRKNIRGS